MPPPSRAKIEISDAPKPRPTSGWMIWLQLVLSTAFACSSAKYPATPSRPRPTTSRPVIAPPLKATCSASFSPTARRLRGAHVGAHRDVHADDTAGAGEHRADEEAPGRSPVEEDADEHEQDHADHGDGLVLAPEVGDRAFAHREGDFAHALVALGQSKDGAGLPGAVADGEERADEREDEACVHVFFPLKRGQILSGQRGQGALRDLVDLAETGNPAVLDPGDLAVEVDERTRLLAVDVEAGCEPSPPCRRRAAPAARRWRRPCLPPSAD
jgi:hypothetical protein